jgi:hypothetical protein
MSSVKYELGSYIPEDGILHSHRRENFKSYEMISIFVRGLKEDYKTHFHALG